MIGDCPIGHHRNFSRTDEVASQSVTEPQSLPQAHARDQTQNQTEELRIKEREGRKEARRRRGETKTVVLPPARPPWRTAIPGPGSFFALQHHERDQRPRKMIRWSSSAQTGLAQE